jgi:hypothetical protein
MEWIAYRVSDTDGDAFNDLFIKNLLKSEMKALTKVRERAIMNTSKERERK